MTEKDNGGIGRDPASSLRCGARLGGHVRFYPFAKFTGEALELPTEEVNSVTLIVELASYVINWRVIELKGEGLDPSAVVLPRVEDVQQHTELPIGEVESEEKKCPGVVPQRTGQIARQWRLPRRHRDNEAEPVTLGEDHRLRFVEHAVEVIHNRSID